MGMTNRIRDSTTAPPFVPGSRKTGRLLFSDMFNAVDDAGVDFVLLSLCMKALLLAVMIKGVVVCFVVRTADGAKACTPWLLKIVAIAHTQRVTKIFDLAMVENNRGMLLVIASSLARSSIYRRLSTWK